MNAPTAARVVPLPTLPEGWHVVAYSILADGDLAVIGTDADLSREWRRDAGGKVLGKPMEVAAGALARIWLFDGEEARVGPEFPLETPFPIVDRFPDGRWLVANSRMLNDPDNARVISPEGREIRRFRLGDGIMQLKVDEGSSIWVGWFDEGVFGNDDWRVPGLEWAPSAYGLAAFDDRGAILWKAERAPTGSEIADCYALNVAGGTAWACTYPDFPISQSRVEAPAHWLPTSLTAPRALAVQGSYVLAAGGYGESGNQLWLGRLNPGGFSQLSRWRLPFNVGFPDAADFVDGRGDQLHIVREARGTYGDWNSSSIEEPASSMPADGAIQRPSPHRP